MPAPPHPAARGSSPSSSPMRSSFHVQQSSINLIHSPGREPAASANRCPSTATAARPPCVGFSPRRPAQVVAPARCLHASAPLHSGELLANEATEPGSGTDVAANQQRHSPGDYACWVERGRRRRTVRCSELCCCRAGNGLNIGLLTAT